jgi:hypothetical protein
MAPPPATKLLAFMALLTIIMASFKLLSASWMSYSAPPLMMIVAVWDLGQFLNKLYLSAPNWTSSKFPQIPKTAVVNPLTVVWI